MFVVECEIIAVSIANFIGLSAKVQISTAVRSAAGGILLRHKAKAQMLQRVIASSLSH